LASIKIRKSKCPKTSLFIDIDIEKEFPMAAKVPEMTTKELQKMIITMVEEKLVGLLLAIRIKVWKLKSLSKTDYCSKKRELLSVNVAKS
jgi:hypothetical protein